MSTRRFPSLPTLAVLGPLAVLGLAPPGPARAQTVPVDILSLYDRIPSPPSTPQEAYRRAECTVEDGCHAERAYEAVSARFQEVAAQIDLALAASSQPMGDPLQGMTPEELQAKLATMSQQEQVAFAMAMSRQAGSMALQPEPAAVQEAVAAMQRVHEELGRDGVEGGGFTVRLEQLQADLERERIEIGTWATSDELEDASGLPGPGWEQAQLEASDRHLAAVAVYQQGVLDLFGEELSRQRARYSDFQEKLAAIGYGADAVNAHTRTQLIGVQQGMLRAARPLMGVSLDATRRGASLQLERAKMERTNR